MTKIISNSFNVTPVYDGENGAPGKDGESALAADITNEMDSVAMDSGGAVLAQTVLTTTFNMWFGTARQSLSALTASSAATGVTVSCNASTGVVTITIAAGTTLTGDKNVIALTGVCSKGERTVQFTVAGVRGGENGNPAVVYSLVPSASEIVKKKDGSYNPTGNITCAVTKNVGGNQITPAASEYTLKMKVNGGAEQNYAPVASNTVTSSIEFILYVNSVVVDRETVPLLEDGTNGQPGAAGKGITGVTEYYLATSSDSGVTKDTPGWSTSIQTITETNKYLWNYEVVSYSDGTTSSTDPAIIGTYGRNGTNGKGISSITEYYLASSSSSGVTKDTPGWTTSIQTVTATNKYLWNYEVVTYTDNSTTSTDPVIIGTYGDKGDTGTGIASIAATFNLSKNGTSTNETTAPTDLYYNTWQSSQPAPTDTYPYVWKKEVTTYKNPTSTETKYYCIAAKGTKGDTGPMFYLCGQFPDKAPYSKDDYRCPVVYYSGEYWYLKANSATASDTPSASSSVWGKAEKFDMVFTDVLFVKNFAKLGSGIINGDWLISCAGYIVINDEKTYYGPDSMYAHQPAYLRFDPDYPNSDNGYQNFMPVYAVDLKTGKTYQQDAYIEGTVNAKGGNISGVMTIGGTTGQRIILDPTNKRITGYNSGGTVSFSLSANDGNRGGGSLGVISDNYAGFFSSDYFSLMCQTGQMYNRMKIVGEVEYNKATFGVLSVAQNLGVQIGVRKNGTYDQSYVHIDNLPTSGSSVGDVYRDSNGYLRIKIS